MAYVGTPIDTTNQFQSLQGKRFSGNGSTTAFTLDIAPTSVFDIEVFVENVRQDPNSAYTLNGTTLTFAAAPASGTNNIYVIHQAKAVGTINAPIGGNIDMNGVELVLDEDGDTSITADTDDRIDFKTGGTDRVHFDGSGNVFIGKTSAAIGTIGAEFTSVSGGISSITRDNGTPFQINRKTSDGSLVSFLKDGTVVGSISSTGGVSINIDGGGERAGISFVSDALYPRRNSSLVDNTLDLGHASYRFDDLFATNGTIQTSDQNEKNTIADSDLGLDFINRLSPKSYKFNDKTRTHYGLIAQDVETVLSDISKTSENFAGFIKSDISEEQNGSSYRYGLRYHEFIAPLIKAIKELKAENDSLKARVTTLEG
jgi:ribosomal protein S6E (S10)